MTPIDFTEELKLYQTKGYEASLGVLREEERRIAQKKELLSMLTTIEALTELINAGALQKAVKVSVYIFDDGSRSENALELLLFDKEGKVILDKAVSDYFKILNIFDNIKNNIGYLQGIFELTPSGLAEFQKEWLGEELCVSLEKALIAQEIAKVDNPTESKKTHKI